MSSLEASVTLEDVFTVVEAKRVPLAPELAGYLTLEIADGTDAGSGDVDPRTVFISEEGTVALVRPKKEFVSGDAEASIRTLLAKLLDASGSGTPALSTAARRKPGNGLPALVEELEAALIPVNRAAGRRALARLAREVKRVLLGVGRNASVPPVQSRPETKPTVTTAPHARPALRKREGGSGERKAVDAKAIEAHAIAASSEGVRRVTSFEDEPKTAKRANQLDELLSTMNEVESGPLATTSEANAGAVERSAPQVEPSGTSVPLPDAQPPPPAIDAATEQRDSTASPERAATPAPTAAAEPPAPPSDPTLFGGDEVDSLLDSFGVSNAHEDKQMARELKAIAGLSPTPPPPDAKALAELTKDVGKRRPRRDSSLDGDSVEALLALTDASGPLTPPLTSKPPHPSAPQPGPPPSPPANPPPSPVFGGSTASTSEAVTTAGAPAALRKSANATSPLMPPAPPPPPPSDLRADSDPFEQPEPPRLDPPRPVQRPAAPPLRTPSSSNRRTKLEGASAKPAASSRNASADRRPRAPKTGMAMLVFALLVLAGGTVAIWKFAPQVFTGKKRTATSASAPLTALAPPTPKCKVALVLTDVPSNAEILLRMGQAPLDVERMPVGTRLEFVATAEGYAPRRAVIKGESPWDKGPEGKPRIEVPIQLDSTKAKPGSVDPWPLAEPGSQVGGSGAPGTVHVVSNVRGAEVWLLAGLGPEARIDQLRCDADIDVLFAGPPALRRRLHVSEADVAATAADAAGNKIVNVSAK